MAIPPRMLPTATPSSLLRAALTVMAISGRLVTMANRISPPKASPRPRRKESTSVVSESLMPAIHTKAAEPAKMSSTIGKAKESNISSCPYGQPPGMPSSSLFPPAASQQGAPYAVCLRGYGNQRTHSLIDTYVRGHTNGSLLRRSAYPKRTLYDTEYRRADERTRTAYPCSLRVCGQWLLSVARVCNYRIDK